MNIQRHRIKTVIFVLTNNIQGYIISNIFSAYILEGCVFMAIYPVYNPVFIYSSFSSFPNALMYTPVAIPIPGTIVFCKIYTPGYIPQIIYSTWSLDRLDWRSGHWWGSDRLRVTHHCSCEDGIYYTKYFLFRTNM